MTIISTSKSNPHENLAEKIPQTKRVYSPELQRLEIRERQLELRKKKLELLKLQNETKDYDPSINLKTQRDRLLLQKIEQLRFLLSESAPSEQDIPGMESNYMPIFKGKEREIIIEKMLDMVLKL